MSDYLTSKEYARREQHYRLMAEFSRDLDVACIVEHCEELAGEIAQGMYYQKLSELEMPESENYQRIKFYK